MPKKNHRIEHLENFVEEELTLTLWGDMAASEGGILGKA